MGLRGAPRTTPRSKRPGQMIYPDLAALVSPAGKRRGTGEEPRATYLLSRAMKPKSCIEKCNSVIHEKHGSNPSSEQWKRVPRAL